jgi:hypothetical protein
MHTSQHVGLSAFLCAHTSRDTHTHTLTCYIHTLCLRALALSAEPFAVNFAPWMIISPCVQMHLSSHIGHVAYVVLSSRAY